nr:FERM/acyl-CoA-binding protein, 3-helical bundle [Tanacetum cinerariifolium]
MNPDRNTGHLQYPRDVVDEPSETKPVVFNAEILDESMTLVDVQNVGKCVKLTCDDDDDDDDIDEDVKKDTGLISDSQMMMKINA